jgi:NADH dehydrogenase
MSKKSQEEALDVLQKFNVQIILNTAVKDYVDDQVLLANGETIPTTTLIWASGVVAREVPGLPADVITRGRRIMTDEINRVKNTTNIFCIGDQSFLSSDPKFPNGHPQVAQPAIQQGKLLAANLTRLTSGEATKPFRYNDKGNMAIIAKYKAVADLPKLFFKGFFAWLVWLFIHIIPLVGFRNKMQLFFSWMYAFITNDPTLRLIIRPRQKDKQVIGKI